MGVHVSCCGQWYFRPAVLLVERKSAGAVANHNVISRRALFRTTCGARHGAVLSELAGMLLRSHEGPEALSVWSDILVVDPRALATANAILLHARPAHASIWTWAIILPATARGALD